MSQLSRLAEPLYSKPGSDVVLLPDFYRFLDVIIVSYGSRRSETNLTSLMTIGKSYLANHEITTRSTQLFHLTCMKTWLERIQKNEDGYKGGTCQKKKSRNESHQKR